MKIEQKNIIILNGPNLNLLGKREPEVYGKQNFHDYFTTLEKIHKDKLNLFYFQSNHEGKIIDKIHEIGFSFDGIILNAGAYTHTSIAIADALSAVKTPTIEVHISNVYAREPFRHKSYLSAYCKGIIVGFGLNGYNLAIQSFLN